MLLVLFVVSVLLNIALIAVLKEVGKERRAAVKRVKKAVRKNKEFTNGLVKTSVDLFKELEDIRRRLDHLEGKYKELEKTSDKLQGKVDELEDANSRMANNNYQLIKEGRIIKSKFLDTIFTYSFTDLTTDEVLNFFGRLI